jgi:hypothetical protein
VNPAWDEVVEAVNALLADPATDTPAASLKKVLCEKGAAAHNLAVAAFHWLGQMPLPVHVLNVYSPDPNERMTQLINQSEDLRQTGDEWGRFWMNDMPSHLTPDRIQSGTAQGGDAQ